METAITGWEQLATEYDITDLRWTLHRMSGTTHAQLDRLKALGATVNVVSRSYPLAASAAPAAPFRMVVDNGIHAGIHMDGGHIATLNPWHDLSSRLRAQWTRRAGQPRPADYAPEALRLFTRANAYQMRMEDKLGSIEVGKLADLVVLDKDYLAMTGEEPEEDPLGPDHRGRESHPQLWSSQGALGRRLDRRAARPAAMGTGRERGPQ